VSASSAGKREEIAVWIDTAFNGALVLPRKQIAKLGLVKESSAEAILADGPSVELETFACFFDWLNFGSKTREVKALIVRWGSARPGRDPSRT